jgi:pyruvate kinase
VWYALVGIPNPFSPLNALCNFFEAINSMRLNFSHGSYEYHAGSIANLRGIMEGSKRACSIMLDTKGPEIRSGKVKGGSVNLKQGQKVVLTWDEKFKDLEYDGSDGGKLYHDYTRITDSLVVGDVCLVDDGLIGLEVIAVEGNDLVTRLVTCTQNVHMHVEIPYHLMI